MKEETKNGVYYSAEYNELFLVFEGLLDISEEFVEIISKGMPEEGIKADYIGEF